jgi:MFS transporter, DHA1 family, multidrug resistance protein
MINKIRTHHDHPQGRAFSWLVLMMGIAIGMIFPIFPSFVKDIAGSDSGVSLFYSAMALIMLVGSLMSTIIFKEIDRPKIAKAAFIISAVAFLGFIFTSRIYELSIFQGISVVMKIFLVIAMSLFVRDFTKVKDLSREEGFFYRFHNIGFLIGPLVGGFLAANFGYEIVFFLSAITMFVAFLYFHHLHVVMKHIAIVNTGKTSLPLIIINLKRFFSDINRTKAYVVTLILMIWRGFRSLYVPLYVLEMGHPESMSGIIIAIGVIPLILLEVKVGEYASKKGIRLPISIGFLIIAVSLFAIFFSPFVMLNFAILILANIGAALVEPLQEYFLFKHTPKKEEDELYGVYMTADPIAFFLAPAAGALMLLFLPFNYLFLMFGIVSLVFSGYFWTSLPEK